LALGAASAQDTVYLSSAENDRSRIKVEGEVVDFTGTELTIRLAGGNVQKMPAERVVEIVASHSAEQTAGDLHFKRGQFSEALVQYRAALDPDRESRAWVRRQILARGVWCFRSLGDWANAGETFLLLLRSDPSTPQFACIPLVWIPPAAESPIRDRAREWLKNDEPIVGPAARLMAASQLAGTADQPQSAAVLAELARSADPRISALASAQRRRTDFATIERASADQWEEDVLATPPELRAGPYFLLGRSMAREGRHELAALAFLRIPTVYSMERDLAARSLVDAGLSLEKIGQTREAAGLYREVVERHAGSTAEAEARACLLRLENPG
jgi:tetratricopeptide (TPR) repeat protein